MKIDKKGNGKMFWKEVRKAGNHEKNICANIQDSTEKVLVKIERIF